MLNSVKLLLGINDNSKDDLLTLLIENAIEECLNFTHRDCISGLETVIPQMVVYNYNRLGTEGLGSESYSGASFQYSTDYPDSIMRSLKAKRIVRLV